MRPLIFVMTCLLSFAWASCDPSESKDHPGNPQQPGNNGNNNGDEGTDTGNNENMRILLTIGSAVFTVTLAGNATATAFIEMLPLTVNMSDVNSNEKYIQLDRSLPVSATNPGRIQTGDLMLWGSDGLVLFYKTFSTSYRYTRLGSVDNTSGLEAALGSSGMNVKFDIQE